MPSDDMQQAKPVAPPVPLPNGGTMPVRVSSPVQPAAPNGPQVFAEPVRDVPKLQGAQAEAEKTVPANRKFIIGGIAGAIVLIAAVIAGIVTYNLEVWGGKSLPEVTVPTSTSDSSQAVKADVVIKQLESKGLKAKQSQEFSGLKKGMFLGYDNAEASQRVKQGSTVTVRVSAGPGVPKDTVGKKAEAVVKTFSNMGVPVHYKQVLVSESSSTAGGGTVVSTSPTPGQGVTDESTGIYIGVATKSDDGLPADIVGQDVDSVRSSLESKGYDVEVEQRLSSKQNVGKVAGADPGPGSKLSSGQTVTLYEGVDAKGAKQTFMRKYDGMDKAELSGVSSSDVAAGRWCNNAGDCITLGEIKSKIGGNYFGVVDGASVDQYAMSDYDMVSCDSLQQIFCGMSKNFLLEGDSGAFEFFPRDALSGFWCGDEFVSTNGAGNVVSCKAGQLTRLDPDDREDSDLSDAKLHMTNFFVVVPTGSDLDALESSGYFDSDALAAAKKQKSVDVDRPFLLYRNPKLYGDKATAGYDEQSGSIPYLPSWRNNAVVKMNPAPSNETAYYLVEDAQPDWDSLDDADVKGASGTTSKSSSTNSGDAVTKSLMKDIAGKYVFSSGAGAWETSMDVKSDGSFEGLYYDSNAGDIDDDHPNGSIVVSRFTGRFSNAKKNTDGSYIMRCDADALKIDGNVGDVSIENGVLKEVVEPYGIRPCGSFVVYPEGYDTSLISDEVKSWGYGVGYRQSKDWPNSLDTVIIVNMDNPEANGDEPFYRMSQ